MAETVRQKRKRTGRWKRFLLLLAAAFFLAVALCQVIVSVGGSPGIVSLKETEKAQAVLVLGAGLEQDGTPTRMLKERLDVGISLYRAQKAPLIVVTGARRPAEHYDEVTAMHRYLLQQGIPEEAILEDPHGDNTRKSMENAKRVLGFDRVLIATTAYHLPRAMFLARAAGLSVQGCGAENLLCYNMPFNWLRETLATCKAVLSAVWMQIVPA